MSSETAKQSPENIPLFEDSSDDNYGDDDDEAEFIPDDEYDEYVAYRADSQAYKNSVLPPTATLMLQKRVRKVVGMWAQEEQMMGNNTYYWHLMKNEEIKMVALQCPTTLEELKALDVLSDRKFQEYGYRLIKNIQNFVQTEALESYIEKKRSADDESLQEIQSHKEAKAGPEGALHATATATDSDDEFPMDINWDGIVLPGDISSKSS